MPAAVRAVSAEPTAAGHLHDELPAAADDCQPVFLFAGGSTAPMPWGAARGGGGGHPPCGLAAGAARMATVAVRVGRGVVRWRTKERLRTSRTALALRGPEGSRRPWGVSRCKR